MSGRYNSAYYPDDTDDVSYPADDIAGGPPPVEGIMSEPVEIDAPVEVMDLAKGIKFDDNKLRWDLLPLPPIEELVKVITYGASKYAPNNWRKVDPERYYAALMRHIVAWRNGEQEDAESGLSHIAHAMCNLVFLHELTNEKNQG
jgi:hypothetical protein